ncbi:hypothetical protein H5410_051397 [Solanum commersonii]|uniref:Uncharacterized protein n=1 Tax=Solanum commersonii TaxID=4109 RepID=A0A9J5WYA9_SOLCO|nr:hypothetical protein H5410_051397 [Solanum commersonii]
MDLTPNNFRVFDLEDPNWAELRSKRLHDPAIMANQSSKKIESKKEVHASYKAKDAKPPKKRGRKVTPPIFRPTLSINDCSNIQPTPEEIRSLDLPDNSHVPPTQPNSSNVNHEEVQPGEVLGFEDFSSKPPEQLFRRSTRVVGT